MKKYLFTVMAGLLTITFCGNRQTQKAETPAADSIQVDSAAQEEETTYFPAIHRYLVDSISSQYAEADIHVPLPTVVAVDESNGEDIKVWSKLFRTVLIEYGFVSSQWDTSKMQDFGRKHFFYIVAGGDQKASRDMQDLAKVLKENEARIDSASWSAKLPAEEQERLAEELIALGGNINFIKREAGSVIPETGRAMEHMASFDYGYKIAAVRDWLFRQSK